MEPDITQQSNQTTNDTQQQTADVNIVSNQQADNNTSGVVDTNQTDTAGFDLSKFFKDGEVGVYDEKKIMNEFTDLTKKYEQAEKSSKYHQSMASKYMNAKPAEKVEDYALNTKYDSSYAHLKEDKDFKEFVNKFHNYCFENKIGTREANLVLDYVMRDSGLADIRTEQQVKEDDIKNLQETYKLAEGYFRSKGITAKQNDELLLSAIETQPVFKEEGIRNAILRLVDTTGKEPMQASEDLKLGSEMVRILSGGNISSLTGIQTGTVSSGDYNAMLQAVSQASSPEEAEAIMDKFYKPQQKPGNVY